MIEPKTVQIARKIAEHGLLFVEDGADLATLLDMWSHKLIGKIEPNVLEIQLLERLIEFDAAFNWNHPHQDQQTEEDLFGMLVHLYVYARREAWTDNPRPWA